MRPPLPASDVRTAAHDCGFPLVGLAPAAPLDAQPLRDWLARGYAAGLAAMHRRTDERVDPAAVVPGAQTVLVLGIPYGRGAGSSAVARYARGRDYHYAHRDRMRRLRSRLLTLAPGLRSYACVDSGAAMEKAWAERAGLGFIGKHALVVNRHYGSWFTLSLMVLDHAVDAYDAPQPRRCADCRQCLDACPTQAFAAPGVLDARRCISYHTVENRGDVPPEVRTSFGARVFGCDACQEACPFNQAELPPGDPRQAPRPLGLMNAATIAAMTREALDGLSLGTPMRRIGADGLRRNACLALGASQARDSKPLLERLARDDSAQVAEAARWALSQLER